mmetsp:Transcript_13989/g.49676  ORF Transcript_13989/g.49676 Transcript_13989/m.49676 type:complete len:283 (-) Transcript_13989:902-1750(-)
MTVSTPRILFHDRSSLVSVRLPPSIPASSKHPVVAPPACAKRSWCSATARAALREPFLNKDGLLASVLPARGFASAGFASAGFASAGFASAGASTSKNFCGALFLRRAGEASLGGGIFVAAPTEPMRFEERSKVVRVVLSWTARIRSANSVSSKSDEDRFSFRKAVLGCDRYAASCTTARWSTSLRERSRAVICSKGRPAFVACSSLKIKASSSGWIVASVQRLPAQRRERTAGSAGRAHRANRAPMSSPRPLCDKSSTVVSDLRSKMGSGASRASCITSNK